MEEFGGLSNAGDDYRKETERRRTSSTELAKFPADSEDVADEGGDDQNDGRRWLVPSGRARSMNGRLFVTYSETRKTPGVNFLPFP